MLKRLELSGFKSFHQKTSLDFSGGISVIVGPNGSGKSNVIDGIRWLLGERDAKNVRGAKSEDLIFSGTDKKARVGMAQASLFLDNSDKSLPIDFSEVAIVRKLYRDGSAECFINKSRMRLKDVVSFFAQAGLGTKGLAVINQGSSDAFVKATPEDRRGMLEEILGLRQYQLKKHDAELKLTSTKQNLEKAETAVNELLPHLRLLRRQAGKWEKRAAFAKELSDWENNYFASKINELEIGQDKFAPRLDSFDKEIEKKRKELQVSEEEIKKIETGKPTNGVRDDRRFTPQRELGQLEAQLRFLSADQRLQISSQELLGLVKKIHQQIKLIIGGEPKASEAVSLLRDIYQQINNVFTSGEGDSVTKKKQLEEQINSLQKELDVIEKEERGRQEAMESFNQDFRRIFTAVANKRDEISQLNSEKNRLLLEKDRWHYRWQDLEERARQAGRQLSEFKNIQLASADFDLIRAEQRMIRLRNELAMIGEIDQELIKEAKEAEERYQFLSSQMEDLGKAVVDLEKIIIDLDGKVKNDFTSYLKAINRELDGHFKLLFNGGKARLISDETGIDIEATVPSKGIKSLNAMSGGEKSLLAIAVLFSLVSVNPPPFLVFDEIDAALDENNSRRFIELLNKFSNKTQFIIVTHNRMVMEAANVLYGVTMDNNGVSKVLSLKL